MKENNQENLFEKIKKINEKEKQEQAEKERAEREQIQKREKIIREEYEKRINQERIELLKIKQGRKSDLDFAEKTEKIKSPEGAWAKIENFFYHYKVAVIVGIFILGAAVFLIQDYINTERPDGGLLYITETMGVSSNYEKIENILSQYGKDYNGDGKKYYPVYYIPIDDKASLNPQIVQANMSKLMVEFQDGETLLIIANEKQDEDMKFGKVLADLTGEFPDNENVKPFGFYLKGTKFAELLGVDDVPEGTFIGIRKVVKNEKYSEEMQEKYDIAHDILVNFIEEMSE